MNIQLSQRISQTGSYAFAEVDKEVAKLKEQGVHVIDFGVGDPTSPTPEFVMEEVAAAAKRHATTGYPSYFGSQDFRQACADYMQETFSVALDPETQIASTIGSKEAVFNFPLGFVDPGDVVICPTPGYPPYKTGTKFAGGTPYFVPLLEENNFLIDFAAIPADVCQKAKIIWTNYPNSPSGALAPKEWLAELSAWAIENEIIIAADEGCYIDMYVQEKPVSILEVATEGIITFYSLSKRNNMTGYRVGFVAGDEEIVNAFKKVKTNIDSGTPNFVQEAGIVAMKDMQHAEEMREEYRKKRQILEPALEAAGLPHCHCPSTFYIWQKAPEGMSGVELAKKFLELGIVVTPGAWISDVTEDGVNPGENFVRFALVATMENVEEASKRLAELSL